ncbi:MAG: flagellar biosynthesis anti-sigma factor FlgM [Verrucomicrobiota bacterium]
MGTTNATTSQMKVNPNRDLQTTAPASRTPKRPAQPAAAPESDFQASTKLALKLAATPTVRADKVARAKTLIADPNYPNAKVVKAVAGQLADKIQSAPDSEA